MKAMPAKERKGDEETPDGADVVAHHAKTQAAEYAAICRALRTEIDALLPEATSKIWHAMPFWFIGDNLVVGCKASPKHVNLLFCNGRSFGDPTLKAAGNFRAAQIQFTDASRINSKALRRWLKKAGTDIWDYKRIISATEFVTTPTHGLLKNHGCRR